MISDTISDVISGVISDGISGVISDVIGNLHRKQVYIHCSSFEY